MSSEKEEDIEEEEVLVLVEMAGIMDTQHFQKTDNEWKILGVETEQPVLQVGNYIMIGEYEDIIGTSIFFEVTNKESSSSQQDPFEKPLQKVLKYMSKADKKLLMKRAFLSKRNESDSKHDAETKKMDLSHMSESTN